MRLSGAKGLPFSIPMDASNPSVSGFKRRRRFLLYDVVDLLKQVKIVGMHGVVRDSVALVNFATGELAACASG